MQEISHIFKSAQVIGRSTTNPKLENVVLGGFNLFSLQSGREVMSELAIFGDKELEVDFLAKMNYVIEKNGEPRLIQAIPLGITDQLRLSSIGFFVFAEGLYDERGKKMFEIPENYKIKTKPPLSDIVKKIGPYVHSMFP